MHSSNKAAVEQRHAAQLGETNSYGEALRAAQELVVLAPEFHATNLNIKRPEESRAQESATASLGRSYKAVVYVMLSGGLDSYNVLVPKCDAMYRKYEEKRGFISIPKANLNSVNVTNSTWAQPCEEFGIHSALPSWHSEFLSGSAVFVANVGPLVEPTTRDNYYHVKKPSGLFAHNHQQNAIMEVHAADKSNPQKGVLARIMNVLGKASPSGEPPFKTKLYNGGRASKVVTGDRRPTSLGGGEVIELSRRAALQGELANLTGVPSGSVFAETYASLVEESLRDSVTLRASMSAPTTASFGRSSLCRSLQSIAKMINARKDVGAERDAFSAGLGAFDHHSNPLPDWKLNKIEECLAPFIQELKIVDDDGVRAWDGVTIVIASEFGRSIVPNGQGTDHGWGGHAFLLGGAVRGGRIVGQYPPDYDALITHPATRGRIVPTMSWEAVWHGIAQWLGVEESVMGRALPGKAAFECDHTPSCGLLTREDLFKPE